MEANSSENKEGANQFKQAIADQIALMAGITPEQALSAIEDCKKADSGDYSIPIPKINKFKKLDGKPNDICKKWSEEVIRTKFPSTH
jgi:hypothetical protein